MPFLHIFSDGGEHLKARIAGLYAILLVANIGTWAWAFIAFYDYPLLLGTAALAYSFGLRHAFDADHIAAIDNVTRKLMQEGKQPVGVGFFFSLGHSTIVILASVVVAGTALAFKSEIETVHGIGGVIGTLVSALFLFVIAIANIFILVSIWRAFRRVRAGGVLAEDDLEKLLAGRGFLVRIFRRLFRLVTRSWHMYPLGLLFGLGFDTATEIGLLGISAAGAAKGMSVWSILIFPALFTAGMSLMDSTDSILMLRAYGWAYVKPIRKLYYNLTITFVSVVVALLIGGIEVLSLAGDRLALKGWFWENAGAVSGNLGTLGYAIVGVFAASWIISMILYRARGYDRIEAGSPAE